jgi:homoserine kinase
MMNTSAEVFAPATMANLGVGFDILGLALEEPGDIVRAEIKDTPGVEIAHIEGDDGKLTRDPTKNTAGVAAASVLRLLSADRGVRLTLFKRLPLASGLGSSAASAVAAAVAVNAILGYPLSIEQLLPAALDGEAAVSGYHADNVGPCLFGGITLVSGIESTRIRRMPIPTALHLAMVTPDVAVPTAIARSVLPTSVPLRDMVRQTAAVARLIDAIYRDDVETMAQAMESDGIIEPARAHLIPMLAEVRVAAKRAGALAVVISGAGPTLCAICDSEPRARAAASAMQSVYNGAQIPCIARSSRVSSRGARVLAAN